jgi:hypothetical protein
LILLQQLIKNNRLSIQGHLGQKKRVTLVEDLGLSSTERIRIVRIDTTEYIQFTHKGSSPTVIPHKKENSLNLKSGVSLSDSKLQHKPSPINKIPTKKNKSVLSDAISNARKMNPKLGFKK